MLKVFLPILFWGLTHVSVASANCQGLWSSSHAQLHFMQVDELLDSYRRSGRSISALEKLAFVGIPAGKDVYNPTKPFEVNGRRVLVARVESRHSETDTVSMFFEEMDGKWQPVFGAQVFKMQDPFFSKIDGELILGGVETYRRKNGELGYRTVFYRGTDYLNLQKFAVGPDDMKDIRLVPMGIGGKIGVFTRPQGKIAGTDIDAFGGRIGFTILDDLSQLNQANIAKAPLIPMNLNEAQWLGVNEGTYRFEDGLIEVLGHIAKYEENGSRSYYLIEFLFDPTTGVFSHFGIQLERRDLVGGVGGEAKRPELANVIFSGGKEKNSDGTAWYTVGAGDAETHRIRQVDSLL